jgi:hypothetical protein
VNARDVRVLVDGGCAHAQSAGKRRAFTATSAEDLPLLDSAECSARLGSVGHRLGPSAAEMACYERESPAP